MKAIIPLSLITMASIYANEIILDTVSVESTKLTEVSENTQVSADLSQALSGSVPSIDMNRRSGIANDILIRGQKRDNISVEVDGTKVCGACPNRMDPPVSHILANQIDEIVVTEGPYDVETFGVLSGGVKITTKKPTKDLNGEVNLGYGSWNYMKVGATAKGGNDFIRMQVSASSESSDQYKDGNGNTIAQQIDNYAANNPLDPEIQGTKLQDKYKDMKAYDKKSVMAKAFVSVTDDQELRLSYTANRSDDILYGNSKMDALYDDSNIYSVEYDINNISDIYKNANIQYYKSDVVHPMSTKYRVAATDITKEMTSKLETSMNGIKLKNSFDIQNHTLLVGVDSSTRTWDGSYYKNGVLHMIPTSIDNAVTKNNALFAKLDKSMGNVDVSIGARYDLTKITLDGAQAENDYSAINANVFSAYNLDKQSKLFLGLGQASRVPDARELYFKSAMGGLEVGTPDLKQTTNQEIDFGYETNNDNFTLKAKAFYSILSDYIYYQKSMSANQFKNIDATVYGTELSASVYPTDELMIDAGVSYKKGQKKEALPGQSDKDLADIAPLRANMTFNYEYMNNSIATLETQFSNKWNDVDSDNGEQVIDAYKVINLKVKHAINRSFDFTLGVNNLLDETYAVSNTYTDLTLLTTANSDIMLMNEPGRYIYTNLTARF